MTPSFSCVQTPDIVLLEIHNPGGGGNLQLRRAKEIHWTFLQKSCRICRQGLLEVCTCEKLHARAYGNLTPYGSTLWEGWSDMPLIIVVQFYARKIGREHSTCCGRNLCIVTSLYHNILLVFGLIILWHPEMSLISVDLIVAYDQFYILFWIRLESSTAYCLSWRYLHWFDIGIVYCLFDTEKLILSKGWEQTAETLGEEFKLAESTWWREATTLWVWTMRCIGIVRTMSIFGHLICLTVLWWDVSVLRGQYLHHRHHGLQIRHLILDYDFYCFEELWHSSTTLIVA